MCTVIEGKRAYMEVFVCFRKKNIPQFHEQCNLPKFTKKIKRNLGVCAGSFFHGLESFIYYDC